MKIWSERVVYRNRRSPLIQRGRNLESDFPWRVGVGVILRLPFSRHAISFGWWNGEQPKEIAEGFPTLSLRPLDNPEEFFHAVPKQREGEQPPY